MLFVARIEVMDAEATKEEGEQDIGYAALRCGRGRRGVGHRYWCLDVGGNGLFKVNALGVLGHGYGFDDGPNPHWDTADTAGY